MLKLKKFACFINKINYSSHVISLNCVEVANQKADDAQNPTTSTVDIELVSILESYFKYIDQYSEERSQVDVENS